MDTSKKKILIVEDEKDLRDLYIDILQREGYDVTGASDGEEGYMLMHKGGYDLVLLDIMMPKMDGFEILEKLKNTPPQKPNRAIVILTNLVQDMNMPQIVRYGVRDYIVKSDNTPDQIIKKVKDALYG